jgi:hypothetical protein
LTLSKGPSNDLVDRVVATHVFAQREKITRFAIEQRRRV